MTKKHPRDGERWDVLGADNRQGTTPDPAFEDIVRLAAHLCRTPMALINRVESERFVSLAQVGLEGASTPDALDAFSSYAVQETELFVVPDTSKDARFASQPWVTSPPGLRFYAGLPLRTPEGEVIGTLSVMDVKPRALRRKQKEMLQILGRQALAQRELRHHSAARQRAEEALLAREVDRVQTHKYIREQYARLTAIRAIDVTILSYSELKEILEVVLRQVCSLLNVDAASILRLDPSTQQLECVAGQGFYHKEYSLAPIPVGRGVAGQAAQERSLTALFDLSPSGGEQGRAELLKREGFVEYFAMPLIARGAVKGVLEIYHRSPMQVVPDWRDFLDALAGQAAIAIESATLLEGLQRSNRELVEAYDTTIEGWSRALDIRDSEIEGHSRRVMEITVRLARAMGCREEDIVPMRRGALLHDIGKMGIPDSILQKPGKLTPEEWEIMRKHPIYAYEMLAPISFLCSALDIPYCHHEKWDGTGYPHGLRGEQIPLAARIFAIADVYDALCYDRPYRSAWPEERVLEHIQALAGTHFDPEVVKIFLEVTLAEKDRNRH